MKFILLFFLLFIHSAFALDIKSNSYFLIEANSNKVLIEKQADLKLPPASITKIMTAYIVFSQIKSGKIKLNELVLISKTAAKKGGSKMFIATGSKVSVENLLKGMIISSGNDASIALAEYIAGTESEFAKLMNQTAKSLGMKNTNFRNSTGWPDTNHYSTPRDIAILARALILEFPELYKIFSQKEFTFGKSIKGIPITQRNRNGLLWLNEINVDGIKTGHTSAAGYCLVSSALRNDMRLISIVMKTTSPNSRKKESEKLLKHGLNKFNTKKLLRKNKAIMTVPVWKGDKDNFKVGVINDVYVTFIQGQEKNIKPSIKVNNNIIAPLNLHSKIGEIIFSLDNKVIRTEPLVALEPVNTGDFFNNLYDSIMLLFN